MLNLLPRDRLLFFGSNTLVAFRGGVPVAHYQFSVPLIKRASAEPAEPAPVKPAKPEKAKRQIQSNEHWITIHPHGGDHGVPVLIRENKDGTASVVGGAGGKLNFLHLDKRRSPEELAERAKSKKQAEKERVAALSPDDRDAEKRAKIEAKEYHQSQKHKNALETIAQLEAHGVEHGLTPDHVNALSNPPAAGASAADIQQWQSTTRDALRQIKQIHQAYEHRLATDHDALAAARIGDLSLDESNAVVQNRSHVATDATGREIGSLQQLPNGQWLAISPDADAAPQVFDSWKDAAKEHVRQVQLAEQNAGLDRTQDEAFYDPAQWVKEQSPDDLPDGFTFKPEVAAEIARLSHDRKTINRSERQAQLAIAKGNPFSPAYADADTRSITDADILANLKSEAKTLQDAATNNKFLDLVDNADAVAIREHVQIGGYAALADIASDVLKQNPVSRSLVEAIGHNEAAKILAYQLRQNLAPAEYDRVVAAQSALHAQNSARIAKATNEKVTPMLAQLKSTHDRLLQLESQTGGNYTPDQQIELDNLNYQAEQIHAAVQNIVGTTIGQLQASAATVAALEGKPKTLKFAGEVPGEGESSFLDRAGLVLNTDYQYIDTPDGSRVVVNESGVQKLGGQVSLEDKARYDRAVAIKRGEYDEPDYLPAGFASRPIATFTDAQAEAQKFDTQFHVLDRLAQSEQPQALSLFDEPSAANSQIPDSEIEAGIRSYIGARVANGDSPIAVKDDILSPGLYAQSGIDPNGQSALRVQAIANQMILDLASQADPDGTLRVSEGKLRSALNAMADEEAMRQRRSRSTDDLETLNAQTLDPDAAKEAAHRSLAAMPMARVLFKPELTGRERRWLREYAITQVLGQELKSPDREQSPQTSAPNKANEPDIAIGSLFGEPSLTPTQQSAIDRIQGERDRLKESISDRVKMPVNQSPEEVSRYKADLAAAQSDIDAKIAVLNDRQRQIESGEIDGDSVSFDPKALNQWQEFSRLMGGDEKAYAATIDALRDKFMTRFAGAYGVLAGKPVLTGSTEAAHADRLELAKLPEDKRIEMLNAIRSWQSSDRAKVQSRSGGKWTSDPYLTEKLAQLKGSSRQINLFTTDEARSDTAINTKRATIGAAAEQQLVDILPHVVSNFEQVNSAIPIRSVTWSGSDHVTKQRASKFVQAQKKCGLHFGAGSGKSSIALGVFSDLHAQGKVKRSIVAVPSNILGQFVGEAASFLKPDTYNYSANIGWNQTDRVNALKDSNLHVHFTTRESLANDLLTLVETHTGVSRDDFAGKPEADRHDLMQRALLAEGIDPKDLMVSVDEAHDISVRGDAEASNRALAIEALAKHTPYYVEFTGTPVKNDLSEAYSFLHRMDPDKFSDPGLFRSQYGGNSPIATRALQRVMAPYVYAASTKPRQRNPDGSMGRFLHMKESQPTLPLAEAQKTGRQNILNDYETIAKYAAQKRNTLDHPPTAEDYADAWNDPSVRDAIARLSSADTYGGMSDEEKQKTIGGQVMGASAIKNAALWRLYHRSDYADNPKMQYTVDTAIDRVKQGKQGVVFTASEKAAQLTANQLRSKGIRCGVLDGSLSPEQKDAERLKFSPISGEPQYDVLICTDAGQTGANLQRGKFLIHLDVPVTSKSYDQRSARIHRLGQTDDTEVITPMLDVPEERVSWARLERKGRLGRVFQGKSDRIDETGLSGKMQSQLVR